MIFFDFDGTVVDVWDRYYRVFSLASKNDSISKEAYIEAKRSYHFDDAVAAHFSFTLPDGYKAEKQTLLELPSLLHLDKLLIPAASFISFFSYHDARILTSRRHPSTFFEQLEWLGLSELSSKTIILSPDDNMTKTDYIKANFSTGFNIVIGDSPAEQASAKLENTFVFLVSTGLYSQDTLSLTKRCYYIENINTFVLDIQHILSDITLFHQQSPDIRSKK